MCLKQREPYYIIILGFILIIILKWQHRIWFYIGIQIVSIYGLFYSIWHVGIEKKILSGPEGCSSGLNITDNTSSLKEQILSKSVLNCEDVAWSILGFSAATINSFLLILIFILNAIYLWNNHVSKK
jgi:disulfide bond formation protein DsbB